MRRFKSLKEWKESKGDKVGWLIVQTEKTCSGEESIFLYGAVNKISPLTYWEWIDNQNYAAVVENKKLALEIVEFWERYIGGYDIYKFSAVAVSQGHKDTRI